MSNRAINEVGMRRLRPALFRLHAIEARRDREADGRGPSQGGDDKHHDDGTFSSSVSQVRLHR